MFTAETLSLPKIDISNLNGTTQIRASIITNVRNNSPISDNNKQKTSKERLDEITELDIWLFLHLWIITGTRLQRYKRVSDQFQKLVNTRYTDQFMLLNAYNTMVPKYNKTSDKVLFVELSKDQLRNRIRIISKKLTTQLFLNKPAEFLLMLNNAIKNLRLYLFYDPCKLGTNEIGDFEVPIHKPYVQIHHNGKEWELLNATEGIEHECHLNLRPILDLIGRKTPTPAPASRYTIPLIIFSCSRNSSNLRISHVSSSAQQSMKPMHWGL